MKEITVKASDIAAAMGRKSLTHYMESVVEAGHLPGTLSGANIGGEAKRYSSRYARTRAKVEDAVEEVLGVTAGRALVDSRWAKVWVGADGQRVELTLADE